jgi:SAM-dependent methyltransferase
MPWYEDDRLWSGLESVLFTEQRMDDAQEQVDQLCRLIDASDQMRVLDLCCGPGRHAVALARRGHRVTGVDRTERYLERARQRAEEAGVEVDFVRGDMQTFVREHSYDLVISLFTSIGYFEDDADNRAVLANMYASLAPGGLLVLDTFGKELMARDWQAARVDERGRQMVIERRQLVDAWRRVRVTVTTIDEDRRSDYTYEHWVYSAGELMERLQGAGFALTQAFGCFAGSPYDEDAERLVVVARKDL